MARARPKYRLFVESHLDCRMRSSEFIQGHLAYSGLIVLLGAKMSIEFCKLVAETESLCSILKSTSEVKKTIQSRPWKNYTQSQWPCMWLSIVFLIFLV